MKKICTLLFVLSFYFIHAQTPPTIVRSNLPSLGDSFDARLANNLTTFNPGTSGSAVTWNFSSYTGDSVMLSYAAVSNTAFSNVGAQMQLGLSGVGTLYLSGNTNGFYLNGMTSNYSGANLSIPYTNEQTLFLFPMTYGDSFKDTASGNYPNNITYMGTTVNGTTYRTVYSQTNADGYGTLMLPGANYSNVLRAHIHSIIKDSSVSAMAPGYYVNTTTTVDEYYFLSPSYHHQLVYMINVTTNSGTTSYVFYLNNPVVLSTIAATASSSSFKLYPNPATDQLNLVSTNGGLFRMYNANGQVVKTQYLDNGQTSIQVSELPSGLYLYDLSGENGERISSGKVKID